jgi:hypothetical protein
MIQKRNKMKKMIQKRNKMKKMIQKLGKLKKLFLIRSQVITIFYLMYLLFYFYEKIFQKAMTPFKDN